MQNTFNNTSQPKHYFNPNQTKTKLNPNCTDLDVIHGFHNFFTDSAFPLSGAKNITVLVRNSHAADDTIELDSGDWGMIVVIGVFVVLVIVGTILVKVIFCFLSAAYSPIFFPPDKFCPNVSTL